jgi:hypothetical protein
MSQQNLYRIVDSGILDLTDYQLAICQSRCADVPDEHRDRLTGNDAMKIAIDPGRSLRLERFRAIAGGGRLVDLTGHHFPVPIPASRCRLLLGVVWRYVPVRSRSALQVLVPDPYLRMDSEPRPDGDTHEWPVAAIDPSHSADWELLPVDGDRIDTCQPTSSWARRSGGVLQDADRLLGRMAVRITNDGGGAAWSMVFSPTMWALSAARTALESAMSPRAAVAEIDRLVSAVRNWKSRAVELGDRHLPYIIPAIAQCSGQAASQAWAPDFADACTAAEQSCRDVLDCIRILDGRVGPHSSPLPSDLLYHRGASYRLIEEAAVEPTPQRPGRTSHVLGMKCPQPRATLVVRWDNDSKPVCFGEVVTLMPGRTCQTGTLVEGTAGGNYQWIGSGFANGVTLESPQGWKVRSAAVYEPC